MDFEVKISLINDGLVRYTAANRLKYTSAIVLDDLTKQLLERFDYWVGIDTPRYEKKDLALLGQILYHLILPSRHSSGEGGQAPDLRRLFEADYAQFFEQKVASPADRFRLTLELHEDAGQLAQYPWEFLYIPAASQRSDSGEQVQRGFFLAGEKNNLILTRFVPKVPTAMRIRTDEPLRIMVIFSYPRELPPIDSDATREVIKTIEQLGEEFDDVEVRVEKNRTHRELQNLMNGPDDPLDVKRKPADRKRFKPDIVHFIGHGLPNQLALLRDKEALQAEKDNDLPLKDAHWCDAEKILELFKTHTPRLVFLHACESARPESVKGFSSLARELVYSQIPSVVAMQYTITNKDAALFARTFYEEIRNGSRIDEAVAKGRERLGQAEDTEKSFSDRRFGTPVVYFQERSPEPLIGVRRLEDRQAAGRPTPLVATDRSADTLTSDARECPRCHAPASRNFCGRCRLRFKCQCGHPYARPLDNYCEECGEPITQPDWADDAATVAPESGTIPTAPGNANTFDESARAKTDQLRPTTSETPKQRVM